jgi:hypothetical protein
LDYRDVHMNRRNILRMFAAAPIAAPVIAREATTKAGIGAFGLAHPADCVPEPSGYAYTTTTALNNVWDWKADILKNIDRLTSRDERDKLFKNMTVTRLDPDLASSRSLSLSAAINIQKWRMVDRQIEDHKSYWLRELQEQTRMSVGQ